MSFSFPESLAPLRDYLERRGCDVTAFATARQAAFFAQNLLRTKIKFAARGQDLFPTLLALQKAMITKQEAKSAKRNRRQPAPDSTAVGDGGARSLTHAGADVVSKPSSPNSTGRLSLFEGIEDSSTPSPPLQAKARKAKPTWLTAFRPELFPRGVHVFADGAAVPNPGAGGWGVVVYRDGEEIVSDCGGELNTTNNRMEISAVLAAVRWAMQYPAVPVTIWSDSQYVVNGVNDWRHGWKAVGWQRGGPNARPENRILLNADLWRAIDEALCDERAANVAVNWVRGHAGHIGNERADALAEIGRQAALLDRKPGGQQG